MNDELIMKFIQNKDYYKYLKENSEWIKILKRRPQKYKEFVAFVKKKYQLRVQDKLNKTLNKVNVLSEVLSSIK